MTENQKKKTIMDALGLTELELEAMTTPEKDNKRLNKLFDMAQRRLSEEADNMIRQDSFVFLS